MKRCKIRSRKPSEKISAVIQETDGSGPAWGGDSGNGEKKTECQDRGRSDRPQRLWHRDGRRRGELRMTAEFLSWAVW